MNLGGDIFLTKKAARAMSILKNMIKAIENQDLARLRKVTPKGYLETHFEQALRCLHMAIQQGFLAGVRYFVHKGIDINAYLMGMTAIQVAMQYQQYPISHYLFRKGADLKLPVKNLRGDYLTHIMVREIQPENYREFLWVFEREEELLNIKNHNGTSPLLLAMSTKNKALSRYLLNLNPDIHSQDMMGDTPLHYAIENDWVGITALLCHLGAKTDCKNCLGFTPYKMALEAENCRITNVVTYHTEPKLLVGTLRDMVSFQRVRAEGWRCASMWLLSPIMKGKIEGKSIQTSKREKVCMEIANMIKKDELLANMDTLAMDESESDSEKKLACTKKSHQYEVDRRPREESVKWAWTTVRKKRQNKQEEKKKKKGNRISPETVLRYLSDSEGSEGSSLEISDDISSAKSCCEIM